MASAIDPDRDLERARAAYADRAWVGAYEAFGRADASRPLAAADLELLGRSAYMIGRDDDYIAAFERAYNAYLDAGETRSAARCSFWIGHNLLFRMEPGRAGGWFARAQRLLEREETDCVERGYVLQAPTIEQEFTGNFDGSRALAAEIAEIGERFGDRDLVAIGLMVQAHALIRLRQRGDGVRLVDEALVAVTTGELSQLVAGIVYCYTISFCYELYELRRAREWTDALTRWCDEQPEMVAHKGLCLVHRAALMTLAGTWQEALDEAIRVGRLFTEGVLNRHAQGGAAYCEGEVNRLRGAFDAAEAAYRRASDLGREPQPGLALMRLAQGNHDAAAAAIRRAVTETTRSLERAALLPAYVEIMLATNDLDAAATGCHELERLALEEGSETLAAMAAHARGAVAVAAGDATAALVALRSAVRGWQDMNALYEAARARVLVGLACRALGDDDTAAIEFDGARAVFSRLRAVPAIAWLDALTGDRARPSHGLTGRELEVLRLIAAGKRNREIAERLVVSEHTIGRHVQNIFTKLGVSSRTAASAFAFEHDLVSAH
ncbi:MAG: LuxR C-terminal-related transcriptional regulator [Mycobacteriales bacterium]